MRRQVRRQWGRLCLCPRRWCRCSGARGGPSPTPPLCGKAASAQTVAARSRSQTEPPRGRRACVPRAPLHRRSRCPSPTSPGSGGGTSRRKRVDRERAAQGLPRRAASIDHAAPPPSMPAVVCEISCAACPCAILTFNAATLVNKLQRTFTPLTGTPSLLAGPGTHHTTHNKDAEDLSRAAAARLLARCFCWQAARRFSYREGLCSRAGAPLRSRW